MVTFETIFSFLLAKQVLHLSLSAMPCSVFFLLRNIGDETQNRNFLVVFKGQKIRVSSFLKLIQGPLYGLQFWKNRSQSKKRRINWLFQDTVMQLWNSEEISLEYINWRKKYRNASEDIKVLSMLTYSIGIRTQEAMEKKKSKNSVQVHA